MNKFRPQQLSKSYIMKQRLKTGRNDNYNWQTHTNWYPANYKLNHRTIVRIFQQLHHNACHAPGPVSKRWKHAERNFMKVHFADNGSMRYANKYSCHSWL